MCVSTNEHFWVMQCNFFHLSCLSSRALKQWKLIYFYVERKPHYFCSLSLRSVHPCPCNLTPKLCYSGSWPVPVSSPMGVYLDFPSSLSCCLTSSLSFLPGDATVGLNLCGFAPTNCTQIILPTGKKINILNVLASSVQYGTERGNIGRQCILIVC